MVAAYLVGTRERCVMPFSGAVVTLTHTIGVFALGIVTLTPRSLSCRSGYIRC